MGEPIDHLPPPWCTSCGFHGTIEHYFGITSFRAPFGASCAHAGTSMGGLRARAWQRQQAALSPRASWPCLSHHSLSVEMPTHLEPQPLLVPGPPPRRRGPFGRRSRPRRSEPRGPRQRERSAVQIRHGPRSRSGHLPTNATRRTLTCVSRPSNSSGTSTAATCTSSASPCAHRTRTTSTQTSTASAASAKWRYEQWLRCSVC